MRDLAASPRWVGVLGGVLRGPDTVAEPSEYLRLLLRNGFIADVWETTYQQVLPGEDPVLEWVRGTALRPVLAALDDDAASDFQCEYGRLVRAAYPAFPGPGGRPLTLFPSAGSSWWDTSPEANGSVDNRPILTRQVLTRRVGSSSGHGPNP